MRHIFILFTVLLVLSCSSKDSIRTAEREFWSLVVDFDSNFENRTASKKNIIELMRLSDLLQDSTVSMTLFLKKVKFLKAYSSLEELNEYLSINSGVIEKDNFGFLDLYVDRILLLELLGNKSKAIEMKNLLEMDNDSVSKSFASATSLFMNPSEENYRSLEEICFSICDFSFYHISKMEYLKANNKFEDLEEYTMEYLALAANDELIFPDYHFVRYVMAYLSVVLKNSSQEKQAKHIFEESKLGISEGSYVYAILEKISS
ncbi:hypothetical protein [Aliikangiella sp. IMCC44632]